MTNYRRSEFQSHLYDLDHTDGKLFTNSYEWRHKFRQLWFNWQGGLDSSMGIGFFNIARLKTGGMSRRPHRAP
eukprot:12985548-Heterocapsa_arctica.AAC.1